MARKRWRASAGMQARARELRRETTPEEQQLWKALSGRQRVGAYFRRQFPVGGYVLDFFCAEVRLAVELDGRHHADQAVYDQERDAWLQTEQGIQVLRFPNYAIRERLADVLATIDQAVIKRRS